MFPFVEYRKLDEMIDETTKSAFSVELNSKENVKLVTIANNKRDRVLIEGFLGKILELNFLENSLLEIRGFNGILRIDLHIDDLKKIRQHMKKEVTG